MFTSLVRLWLDSMKAICRNCHFLAKEYDENDGRRLSSSLSEADRKKTKESPSAFLQPYYSLKCQMSVWDEGVVSLGNAHNNILNREDRKNKCFFFPYRPGMLFETAREIQKRQDESRQLKDSNMYT